MAEILLAFLTLTLMEIVLGIDNIIFIAIQVSRLPKEQQFKARTIGLVIALIFRIILLLSLSWVMGLVEPLFTILGHAFSGRDLLLLGGGLFLVVKSVLEIHQKVVGDQPINDPESTPSREFAKAIFQIILIDIVFSFDSIITAVGMTQMVSIMIAAVITSMLVMIAISGQIAGFIDRNPTIKMLALAFLIMIGVMLIAESMSFHAPRGYLYFGMFFSLAVELLNMQYRKKQGKRNSPHY